MSDPKESPTANETVASVGPSAVDANEIRVFNALSMALAEVGQPLIFTKRRRVAAALLAALEEGAVERSDLPVGHSNGSFTDDELASVEARVRAQTAEDIAQAIERWALRDRGAEDVAVSLLLVSEAQKAAALARDHAGKPAESVVAALPDADPESDVAIAEQMLPAGADVFGMAPLSSGCRRGECALCDFGSIHAPCAHDCHVPESALPDVVGTPQVRTGDERCSYCKAKDRDECPGETSDHEEGLIDVEDR